MQNIKYNRISLNVPKDWTDGTMVVWSGPMDGNVSPTVVVSHSALPKGEDFSEYITAQQNELMSSVSNFVLHEKSELKKEGLPCIRVKHSWRMDGPRITQLQYCFLTEDHILYTLTCTHSVENFSKKEKLFEEIVTSFNLD